MKILNVSSVIDPVTGGGEAERSFQMSKFLSKLGFDCSLLTIDVGLTSDRKNSFGDGKLVALKCLCRRFYIPKFSFKLISEMVVNADIVHLMGHWTFLNALVYIAIRKHNKPYVVCPAGSLTIFGRSKFFKRVYNFIIGKEIIRNASVCIAVTPLETSSFIDYGVSADKVCVIPNGVSPDDFSIKDDEQFRAKYSLSNREFVLFVGRLNLIKGPDLLLKAFIKIANDFPNIDLIFAGPDGGMLDQLNEEVVHSGLESRVHFIGYIGGADKSRAYHAAKILAIPSRHEAMSIVVLEAGIVGTPVILTDQCGFNQISTEAAGWVVPASVDGLINGLNNALSAHSDNKSVSTNIKKYVAKNFSWDVIVEEYLKLYFKLTKAVNHPYGK